MFLTVCVLTLITQTGSIRIESHETKLGGIAVEDMAKLGRVGKNISDSELKAQIKAIKSMSKGGGMTEPEYFHFMSYVRDHAPQKLLVWGLGYDSVLVNALNEGGLTLFLEQDAGWVSKTDAKYLNYVSYNDVLFRTSVGDMEEFVADPHTADLKVLSNASCWDTVLVDSPLGYQVYNTGRGVPMYTAKVDIQRCLAQHKYTPQQDVAVFVHDCDRKGEDFLSTSIYGKPTVQAGRLRQFMFKTR